MRTIITIFILGLGTFLDAQGLVINEFVASNDSTSMISDEFGDFDDWVELYNNTTETIDMSGYYLSDDYFQQDKWRFPAGITIPGNSYLIVWTDSDNGQGDLHTNFKLSKPGEQIILLDSSLMVIDSLTFGPQETNVSYARIPNGTGNFIPRAPSHGFNNDSTGVFINTINIRKDFEISPNPAHSDIQVDFTKTSGLSTYGEATILITDISGKLLLTKEISAASMNNVITLDISNLSSGMHFLKIQMGSEIFLKKFIVKKHD